MAIYALIGGKVNREVLNNKIEARLLDLTKKEEPKILFIPFAKEDEEKSAKNFIDLMKGLKCKIDILYKKDINLFESYLLNSDILYIGGGVFDDLMETFIKYNLDQILIKHQNDNKIFAGLSAGAMLFAKISMGDKYMYVDNFHTYNYKMVKGIGILNISICPHYQREDLIIYNDELRLYGYPSFGIEEDTCVLIDGDRFYCLKDDTRCSIYYFNPDKDYLMTSLYEGEIYENKNIRS